MKEIFIPESFNMKISHQLFDYIITFVNSQHLNTNSKDDLESKVGFKRFKDFWYSKINLSQKYPLWLRFQYDNKGIVNYYRIISKK